MTNQTNRYRRATTAAKSAVVALAFIAGLSGCSTNTVGVSGSQEYSAATLYRAESEAGPLYKGARSSGKLDAISAKLASAANIRPVKVYVVNTPVPDAILGRDGKIYLTRKLVKLTSDDSELAAVIAHEIGHKISGHPAQRSMAGTRAAVSSTDISKMLAAGGSGNVKAILVGKTERIAALSRQQEFEADAIAVRLLAKAGYDPAAVVRFLKVMQAHAADRQNGISYHPASDSRIERAESLAAKAVLKQ
ncbi:MAG: M48 family metallopeptidase [Martelella sp.]|uniref:M48 family metallopeptidase n=1 Tax=Martelella sp. TaxID=1969699 RepID=UPI003242F7DF